MTSNVVALNETPHTKRRSSLSLENFIEPVISCLELLKSDKATEQESYEASDNFNFIKNVILSLDAENPEETALQLALAFTEVEKLRSEAFQEGYKQGKNGFTDSIHFAQESETTYKRLENTISNAAKNIIRSLPEQNSDFQKVRAYCIGNT